MKPNVGQYTAIKLSSKNHLQQIPQNSAVSIFWLPPFFLSIRPESTV